MRNWTIALNSKTSDGSILFSNFTITEHRVKKRPEIAAKNMPTNLFCLSTIASPDPSSFFFSSFSEKFSSPCPSSTMHCNGFVKVLWSRLYWDYKVLVNTWILLQIPSLQYKKSLKLVLYSYVSWMLNSEAET